MKSVGFKIHGMDCAEEGAILKRQVGPLVGDDKQPSFDILNTKMIVAVESAHTAAIVKAVAQTGMRAAFKHAGPA